MKKLNLIWILLLLGVSVSNAQVVTKLELKYVEGIILTPIRVNCTDFTSQFEDHIRRIKVTNKKDLKVFSKIFSTLVPDTTNRLPDVRLKIEIYFDKGKKILCADEFTVIIDNKLFLFPTDLGLFIEKMKKKYSCKN